MNAAVIVAGGSGERSGLSSGKQLAVIAGRPVLAHTLSAFMGSDLIDEIVVVAHPERVEEYRRVAVDPLGSPKITAVVAGGETRRQSVAAGLAALTPGVELIAVHDGARPLITSALVSSVLAALVADVGLAGLVVGHPAYDTLKTVGTGRSIIGTPDRSAMWVAQTPQVFRAHALLEAYERSGEGEPATDDAMLVERNGGHVAMFPGPRDNLKITVPEDLIIVEHLLELRAEGEGR